jgi:multiple sugar transport system permease protein
MPRRFFDSYYSFIIPGVVALVVLVLYPTIYALQLSLKKWNLTESTVQEFIWFSNYLTIFGEPRFLYAFGRTIMFVAVSTGVSIAIGFLLAVLLNRNLRGKGIIRTCLIVPMVMTPVVVGLTWRFMYNTELGMINYFLDLLGFAKYPFLGRTGTALSAIIVTDIWQYSPFTTLILLAGLESLSPAPFEAADIDGANAWQKLRYITLPLMRGPILVAVLFRVMLSFSAFDTIFVMTGGGPGRSSETLIMYVYRLAFEHWHMGKASAVGIIMLISLIVISKTIINFARKGITAPEARER